MIKPSNLWCNIWLIFVVLRCSCKLAVSTRSLYCNLFPVTNNALVFSVLMYILFSVDHFLIFSKSLERALVKEVIWFQFVCKDRVVSSAYISWWICSNVKAYHAQIGEIKKDRGLIPAVILAWQVSAEMVYALVSQTVVTLLDMIETKPRYLGGHNTLITSLIIDCDRVRRKLYGNQQILVPWVHHYPF